MTADWSPLLAELAVWRTEQLRLPLWWRDDDAIQDTAALRQLVALSGSLNLPLHLAVIPKFATLELRDLCATSPLVVPLVHGWTHENHAPLGTKKSEFGTPRAQAQSDVAQAIERMRGIFGSQLFEMFVPPWNRVDPSIINDLVSQGYRALSTFTPRPARQIAGLVQINTHIDPIHWKAGGGLVPPNQIIAGIVANLQDRRSGRTDAAEPLGFLTHHLVHDPAIWSFTERCLCILLEGGAAPVNLSTSKELP